MLEQAGDAYPSRRSRRSTEKSKAAPSAEALLAVLHVLEQNVDSGATLCRPHRLARGLALQGRKRLIGPVGVVTPLELENELLLLRRGRLGVGACPADATLGDRGSVSSRARCRIRSPLAFSTRSRRRLHACASWSGAATSSRRGSHGRPPFGRWPAVRRCRAGRKT